YVGERAILPDNTWEAGDYIRLDAGLRYEHRLFGDRKVTYRLNVENLTDEEYLQNTAFRALNFGAPLTVLASVQIDL
ncbi:MAG: TonB-dependent siderophore receptor, partial [Opitutales bacterium]